MERLTNLRAKGPAAALLLLALFCQVGWAAASETSFLDTIKAQDEPFDSHAVRQGLPVTQPTVLAREEYQGGSFRVLARKQAIERFRCSSCHGVEGGKEVGGKNALALTHGNVVINHGQAGNNLTCIDCHHPQDREALEDKKGRKIDFDHSYQLCGQCHFRQKRDWLGGAHGKRAANWAGDRVVYNCTTCHNPHSPRFAKRFPVVYAVPLN